MHTQSSATARPVAMVTDTNESSTRPEWCFVTVEKASTWLAQRAHNRAIRKNDVDFLARQMTEGLWRKNPQPLLFDERSGRLVDGQHRLSALVQAQTPMWFRVDYVEDGVMPVLDTGRSRNAADVIALYEAGATTGAYSARAAALKLLLAWEHKRNPFIGQAGGSGRISNIEVADALPRFPQLPDAVQRGAQLQHAGIPGGAGLWAGLLAKFDSVDPDLCNEFFEGMLTGAGLAENSPILAVRNRLRLSRSQRYSFPRAEVAAVVIRGWNAFVRGKELKIVRGRVTMTDGVKRSSQVTFPEVLAPRRQASSEDEIEP